ncbi:MAG: lysoplasmalogenase [Bacilli bacterium]|nr:lysoplasmalogenase [Bacilli bacterium]
MIYLFFTFLASAVIYTIFHFKLKRGTVFFIKVLTSLILYTFALLAFFKSENPEYAMDIVMGLSFGVLGDIFLGLQKIDRKHKIAHLIIGIGCFLLGHVFYSLAFQSYAQLPAYLFLTISVFLAAAAIFLSSKTKLEFGKAKYFSFAYMLISALFLTFAYGTLRVGFNLFTFFISLGALSFVVSDLILSFIYFRSIKKYRLIKYLNIATYYLGQALITLTICLT